MTWQEYVQQRDTRITQLFKSPGATRTIAISAHIWWMDQMAMTLLNMGYNVLVLIPLYQFYTDEKLWDRFDEAWNLTLANLRDSKADLLIGGNSTAIVPHPKTGQLLHDAAGIPVVHYWWDEMRHDPPIAQRNFSPAEYLGFIKNERTLNVIWDMDVLEELAAFLGISNTFHLPLATLPEFWPSQFMPVENRPLAACFLGHCHYETEWIETDDDPLTVWARQVVSKKIAALDRPMRDCILEVGAIPGEPSKYLTGGKDRWVDFRRPWEILNTVYMHHTRNLLVKAVAEKLQGKLALIGKGWDKLGLRANSAHAGEKSGVIYAQSQASLNLFGGCVHGGMPLRPFDIGASGGVIVTHYQRELPALFEPGKECLSFRTQEEMLAILDQIFSAPAKFNAIAQAGRQRVYAEHTWTHRMTTLLSAVTQHFNR